MSWLILSEILSWTLRATFFGLALAVLLQMIRGRMRMAGLFSSPSGALEIDRLQLFVVSLGAMAAYALSAVRTVSAETVSMPDAPDTLFWSLAGSQAFFLTGKIVRTIINARGQ